MISKGRRTPFRPARRETSRSGHGDPPLEGEPPNGVIASRPEPFDSAHTVPVSYREDRLGEGRRGNLLGRKPSEAIATPRVPSGQAPPSPPLRFGGLWYGCLAMTRGDGIIVGNLAMTQAAAAAPLRIPNDSSLRGGRLVPSPGRSQSAAAIHPFARDDIEGRPLLSSVLRGVDCVDCVTGVSKAGDRSTRLTLGYYPTGGPGFYNVGSQRQGCA
jgi:hypothetical protein